MARGRDGGPVFGREVSFREAFPEVETARFKYREWPVEGSDDGTRFQVNPGEYIRCGNPLCRNERGSGLPAGKILREMVESRLETFETSETCKGMERGRSPRRCLRRFRDINVTIRYRESE